MIAIQHRSGLAGFGDARSDIVSALSIVLGRDKAEAMMRDFETLIRVQAEAGAKAAIPTIRAEVIKAVTGQEPKIRAEVEKAARGAVAPLLIGATIVGGLGALFGIAALIKMKRRL